jgi:hypothetical protein
LRRVCGQRTSLLRLPEMRILFDHGVPRGLAPYLAEHDVVRTRSQGWERLANGALLKAAEDASFELFLTTDQNLRYQQNLTERAIAILVLTGSSKWLRVQLQADAIVAAVRAVEKGSYVEVFIPFR